MQYLTKEILTPTALKVNKENALNAVATLQQHYKGVTLKDGNPVVNIINLESGFKATFPLLVDGKLKRCTVLKYSINNGLEQMEYDKRLFNF